MFTSIASRLSAASVRRRGQFGSVKATRGLTVLGGLSAYGSPEATENLYVGSKQTAATAQIFLGPATVGGNTAERFYRYNTGDLAWMVGYAEVMALSPGGRLNVASGGSLSIGGDTYLNRDAADVLAIRRSTNAQILRIYNTYTDSSNYERGFMRWNTNVLEIGSESAGTGVQRQMSFPLGTVTADTPLLVTQSWNNAATLFTAYKVSVTDTASASGSLLIDLQYNGVSRMKIQKDGTAVFTGGVSGTGAFLSSSGCTVKNTGYYAFSSTTSASSGTSDTYLYRDGANQLALRNTTNAQAFRIYNTYTDASNYERAALLWSSNDLLFGTEKAGTGTARALKVQTDGTTRAGVTAAGSFYIGSGAAALATSATDGFLYFPTCGGTPTGTPTSITGTQAVVIDSTTNKIYTYGGGAWNAISGSGGSTARTVLSDTVSSTSYIGWATSGSATSSSVWKVWKTVYTSAGAISSNLSATNIAWDNRYTATYA